MGYGIQQPKKSVWFLHPLFCLIITDKAKPVARQRRKTKGSHGEIAGCHILKKEYI